MTRSESRIFCLKSERACCSTRESGVPQSTLLVIQCRLQSKRLCAKVLYPLCGVPVLSFLIRRLKNVGLNSRVVVATSRTTPNDICAVWAESEGVDVVRGDASNVLQRYIDCLQRYNPRWVVRVTADNPLTCPVLLSELVRSVAREGAEYGQFLDLPVGSGVDVFSALLLDRLAGTVKRFDEREHINLHILRHSEKFRILRRLVRGECARPDLRLTIDTYEDWLSVKSIFRSSDIAPWNLPLSEAIKRLDRRRISAAKTAEMPL